MNRHILARINFFDYALFNSDGGGGGGGDGTGGASGGDGGAAGGDDAAAAAAAAAAASGGSSSPGGDVYKPEGLADHMLGKSNNETIDNMKKALDGYRDRDATNKVPETADAYSKFEGDIPDTIKPHLETISADPLTQRLQEFALQNKIPVPHFQGLMKEFISVSAEMGLMEPVVNVQAERAELVPDVAKHLPDAEQKQAVEKRMNDNFAFLDAVAAKPAEQGGLAKDDVEFAKAMLGDSAKGHRVFEWMRKVSGGSNQNGPSMQTNGSSADADPRKELERRSALPENTWGHKEFSQASYDKLQADYKRHIGD